MKINAILFIALFFHFTHASADKTEDSLNHIVKTHAKDTLSVKAALKLARQFLFSEPDKALTYMEKAASLAEKQRFYRGLADAYVYMGAYYNTKSEFKNTLRYQTLALTAYKKAKDKRGIARGYLNIGMAHQQMSDFDQALLYYKKSEKIISELKDSSGLAHIYANIAVVHADRGQMAKAMEYHLKALTIQENTGNLNGMAGSYQNLGIIYEKLDKKRKALLYFNKSLSLNDSIGNFPGMADALNNIGTIYMDRNDFDSALIYYPTALMYFEKLGIPNGISVVSQNIGSIYAKKKKYDQSIIYFQKAIDVLEYLQEKSSLAYAYLNMGRSLNELKKFNPALQNTQKALALAKEIEHLDIEKDCYKVLYEVYQNMNDAKKALSAFTSYVTLKDSILNLEVHKELLESEKKYETEKKQREIENLAARVDAQKKEKLIADLNMQRKENQNIFLAIGLLLVGALLIITYLLFRNKRKTNLELTLINAKLEALNNELEVEKQNMELKALLSQINPHFIFNALNSVQKYIASNDKEQAYEYLANFGKIMRSTLENSNESFISVSEELETLRLYMELESKRMPGKFSYEFHVDDKLDVYNLKIPPMLLQPYLENAIWHGIMQKESNGVIKINLRKEEEKVFCVIEDNGIGRKKSSELKAQTTRTHRSMGTQITEKRLETLWKKRKIDHQVIISDLVDEKNNPKGTKVEMLIPVEF